MNVPVLGVLFLAFAFAFLNGLNDNSSLVATVIASRALPPRIALGLTALAGFLGPFVFGTAVATTIGAGLIRPGAIGLGPLTCAVSAAICWNLVSWRVGIPSSSSHALVGGLIGVAIAVSGPGSVQIHGLALVLAALLITPLLGLGAGYLVMRVTLRAVWNASPSINRFFRLGQIATVSALSLSHAANDAQKAMGIMTLGLVIAGALDSFHVPTWVILACAAAMALGSFVGGWRMIRKLGGGIMRIRPIHGFTAQAAASLVILLAAFAGGPVSTTQVLSSAIMGVGAAERLGKVHWEVGREIVLTWVLTIPVSAVLSAGLHAALRRWLG